jgi:hypothetical protein
MWNECRERDSIFLPDKSTFDGAFFAKLTGSYSEEAVFLFLLMNKSANLSCFHETRWFVFRIVATVEGSTCTPTPPGNVEPQG